MSKLFWSGVGLLAGATSMVFWLRHQYLTIDHFSTAPKPGLWFRCENCGGITPYVHPSQRGAAEALHREYQCDTERVW